MKKNRDHSSFQMNQLIQQYMKESLERITQEDQSNRNNSFVYLENDTLHLLILYLLMKTENVDNGINNNENFVELSEVLDRYMEDNRLAFVEVIDLLRNRTKGNDADDK